MPRTSWIRFSKKLSQTMRKDVIRLYKSVPMKNSIGELEDSPALLVGEYPANVTTPSEPFTEETQGTTRPHNYLITLDPEVPVPMEYRLLVELVQVRQGVEGAIVEISAVEGGLLGWTLTGSDEAF